MKQVIVIAHNFDIEDIIKEAEEKQALLDITEDANDYGLTLEWFEFCLEHPELKTWSEKAAVFRNEWDI